MIEFCKPRGKCAPIYQRLACTFCKPTIAAQFASVSLFNAMFASTTRLHQFGYLPPIRSLGGDVEIVEVCYRKGNLSRGNAPKIGPGRNGALPQVAACKTSALEQLELPTYGLGNRLSP